MQAPAIMAVLQAARSQGLLDDLDAIVSDPRDVLPALEHASTSCPGVPEAADHTLMPRTTIDTDSSGGASDSLPGSADSKGKGRFRVSIDMLLAAVVSRNEAFRLDVLQLVTSNPRITSLPGELHCGCCSVFTA
jgi:hypothetical protein